MGAAPTEAPTEAPTLLLTQLTMLHHQTPDESPESRERLLLLHRDLRRNPWGAPLPEGAVMWDCDPAPATEEDLLKVSDGQPYPPGCVLGGPTGSASLSTCVVREPAPTDVLGGVR